MKNIELKIRMDNFKKVIFLLHKIKAFDIGEIIQCDTYYNHSDGRLKIREINNRDAEVIFYQRPDIEKSKISKYEITPIIFSQLDNFKNDLKSKYGEEVVVFKKRQLWIYKNTRIHLDSVDYLGNFLELETIVGDRKIQKAMREHKDIIDLLKLSEYEKINTSYSNLLMNIRRYSLA